MDPGNNTTAAKRVVNEIEELIKVYETCLIKTSKLETGNLSKLKTFNAEHGLIEPDSNIIQIVKKYKDEYDRILCKVSRIKEKVNRKTVKISIFGKVSVGKSKVLNSILHHDLFMSGTSHTTSCFVKINKSDTQGHYVKYGDKTEYYTTLEDLQRKVEELSTYLDETTTNILETSASVNVFLNIIDNEILRSNTQIVDSPGSGNKDEITGCIEKESLDADIFIFVMSHGVTSQEISFFDFQSQQSSKPDIFILINGWDNSDNDTPRVTERSRSSITKDAVEFLQSKSGLSEDEARRRIFFVSASEMFRFRINKENILNPQNIHFQARQIRYNEFINFENTLSNYIDNPEIYKLQRHISEMEELKSQLLEAGSQFKRYYKDLLARDKHQINSCKTISERLESSQTEILKNITNTKENIIKEIKVNCASYINQLNQTNISSIASQINKYSVDVFNNMKELQRITLENIKKDKQGYETSLGTCEVHLKVAKPTLKDAIDKNVILQDIPGNSTWAVVTGIIGSVLTITPIMWPINVAGLCAAAASAWVYHGKYQNGCNAMAANKNKIAEYKKDIINNMAVFVKELQAYIEKEYDQMKTVLQFRIDFFQSYSEDVSKCIEHLQIFP